jgi:hypothetical protein
MKVLAMIILAGLVGAIAAPVEAQTTTDDTTTKMQPSTGDGNNPAKPYVDVPGQGGDATGSVGGNANTGGANTGAGNAPGNAPGGNTGNGTSGGGTGTGGAGAGSGSGNQ